MAIEHSNKQVNQIPLKDHVNVLAKVKRAISAALMAGMLTSPLAAKDMKNAKTYQEPTSVERSTEQVSYDQVACNNVVKSFENIIDSDLNKTEKMSPNEMIKQSLMISDEIRGYIENLLYCSRRLQDFEGFSVVLEEEVWRGKIRDLGTDNCTRQTGLIGSFIHKAGAEWKKHGLDPRMIGEALWTEYDPIMSKKIFGENKSDLSPMSHDNLSAEMGIKDIICEIMDHPELAASGKALISKKIKNMCEISPCEFGSEHLREAWLYMYASIDAINARIDRLEKLGYKFDETSLQPHKNNQLQDGLGMDR